MRGLIGGYSSDETQMASFVCRLYKIPQIAYTATAMTFDVRSQYPYFFRGIPSLRMQAVSLANLIRELGYSQCALIGTNTLYDQSAVREFQVCI